MRRYDEYVGAFLRQALQRAGKKGTDLFSFIPNDARLKFESEKNQALP
jgi:hypothetical protein